MEAPKMCQNSEHPPNYSYFDEFFFALTTFDTDQADRWNRTFGLFKLVQNITGLFLHFTV